MQKIIRSLIVLLFIFVFLVFYNSLNRETNYSTDYLVGNKLAKINLESFNDIREKFSDQFGDPEEANIIWKSKEHVDLNENSIQTIFKLINGLDDCEDVQNVFYNFEFDEKSLQILEE